MASPSTPTAAAAAAAGLSTEQLQPPPVKKPWGEWTVEKYDFYNNWVDRYTPTWLNFSGPLASVVDSCAKVMQVFVRLLASIALSPVACLGSAWSLAKACWGTTKAPEPGAASGETRV